MARRRDGGEEFFRLFGYLLLPPDGGVVEEGPRESRVTYPFDHRPTLALTSRAEPNQDHSKRPTCCGLLINDHHHLLPTAVPGIYFSKQGYSGKVSLESIEALSVYNLPTYTYTRQRQHIAFERSELILIASICRARMTAHERRSPPCEFVRHVVRAGTLR